MVHFPVISLVCSDVKYDVFHCSVILQVMVNTWYVYIFFTQLNCKFLSNYINYLIKCRFLTSIVVSWPHAYHFKWYYITCTCTHQSPLMILLPSNAYIDAPILIYNIHNKENYLSLWDFFSNLNCSKHFILTGSFQ